MRAAVAQGVVQVDVLRDPQTALQVIDEHVAADPHSGRCLSCGEESPCRRLNLGYAGLHGTKVLPRRSPGRLLYRPRRFNGFG